MKDTKNLESVWPHSDRTHRTGCALAPVSGARRVVKAWAQAALLASNALVNNFLRRGSLFF